MSSTTTGPGAPPTGAPEPFDGRDGSGGAPGEPDPRSLSSWHLVEAAQTGDAGAFGELYDRYSEVVFRFLVARVQNRTVAEDLTSDTFLRAFRAIGGVSYQGRDVGARHRVDVVERRDRGDAGVAGRGVHLRDGRVEREGAGQGVLAAAGTDDEGPHGPPA